MLTDKPFPEILFDRMRQEDLEHVMNIEKEAFPDPWHVSFFKRCLHPRRKHTHLYVARLHNEVIGYIVFYINCGEAHIMNIAVATECRRRGVARFLLASALEVVSDNAGEVIFLEVGVDNGAARELYKQFGFEIYGIRKRYYSGGGDAYTMRKTFTSL